MNTKRFVVGILIVCSLSCVALADRPLDRAEILQIFEKLTSQPRKTWIPAGTIEATHKEYSAPKIQDTYEIDRQIKEKVREYQDNQDKRELTENLQKMRLDAIPFNVRYRLSDEHTMNSTVVVKFDGERFYWEINVDSRSDSVEPNQALLGNYMTEQFDLDWNRRRIFAWDGEKYTTYFLPGNYAIADTTGNTPHRINGPLTAGIIPWGYGYYEYENLCAIESSAAERYLDGQKQIYLKLGNPDGSDILLVMDPQKDYAVMSCSVTRPGDSITLMEYSNYRLVAERWVPCAILIERYDSFSNRLLASDFWDFTLVSGDAPRADSFDVEYKPDALIEYRAPVTDKPLIYRYSDTIDTDLLLVERLATAASEGIQVQNCATIAMKYALSQLGKHATDEQLAKLISDPDKTTSLYAMKEFSQKLGLYCRAVRTDIQTLKELYGCQAILHIPGKNHFVVLGEIDHEYVRSIDLASNSFFYRTDINFFDMDWAKGTALLVSDKPIQIQGNFTEIAEAEVYSVVGGGGYACDALLQEYYVVYCAYALGLCGGFYEIHYERWGCCSAPSGSCTASRMLRYVESPCIDDPYRPYNCAITGEWTCYYMRACG
jgi:hypothetical protein